MIKEMNKYIFARHLELVINEIKQKENLQFNNEMFSIMPIIEKGKLLTGNDEMMRLNVLNKNRVNNKLFTKDDVISMLTFYSPFVPLWIDVEHISNNLYDLEDLRNYGIKSRAIHHLGLFFPEIIKISDINLSQELFGNYNI